MPVYVSKDVSRQRIPYHLHYMSPFTQLNAPLILHVSFIMKRRFTQNNCFVVAHSKHTHTYKIHDEKGEYDDDDEEEE